MTRFVPVTVVMVVVLAAVRVASAQVDTSTLPGGATIVFEKLQTFHDGSFSETEANSIERLHYFNLAHCNCAKAKLGMEQTFKYLIRETAQSGVHEAVDFWIGTQCADDTQRRSPGVCRKIGSIGDIDASLYPGGTFQDFNLYDVVNGEMHKTEPCLRIEGSATVWAFVSTTGMVDAYDYKTSQNVGTVSGETAANGVDTRPPPLPTDIKANPGDRAINLSWTPPVSNNTDVAYYQALCANIDGTPARPKEQDAQFVTTASLCDTGPDTTAKDPDLTATLIANDNEMTIDKPTGDFGALNADYICGHGGAGTASSLTITGLKNGTPYQVILVSVDLYGNYTGTYLTSTVTPLPSTDFWEDLQGRGSNVEGGLCLLAETYGDDSFLTHTLRAFRDDTLGGSPAGRWLTEVYYATMGKLGVHVHGSVVWRVTAAVVLAPLVMLALLWHWLTLPGVLGLLAAAWWWRRRGVVNGWGRRLLRMRAVRVAAGIATITLGASRAHAGGYQPYWEDSAPTSNESQVAADDPSLVTWHAGIRIGPYVPEIDKQLGMDPGPYEQMFGGYYMLTMLDVDRIVWTDFGQVGIGLSLGYMQKHARAFTIDSLPSDDPRARGSDINKFRLIPMALTATYRFTWLDDEYGIPVVPYVRGGLAYYLWWVSVANGSLAEVCTDGSMDPGCSSTKALGGSLGVQGSIGLAVRAERIDPSTANSMRLSGIQHVGIYGELSLAKVDGFGSESKLSVGDRTWFAGVNFEF